MKSGRIVLEVSALLVSDGVQPPACVQVGSPKTARGGQKPTCNSLRYSKCLEIFLGVGSKSLLFSFLSF